MPVVQMPEAVAPAVVVPDEQTPVDAMSVGMKIPTRGGQGMMIIHAGPRRIARLGQAGTQDQSTDISVGRTMTTTTPTRTVSGATGITRSGAPVLWAKGSVRANLRQATRATTSTCSMTRKNWTSKVHQVRHVSDLGS